MKKKFLAAIEDFLSPLEDYSVSDFSIETDYDSASVEVEFDELKFDLGFQIIDGKLHIDLLSECTEKCEGFGDREILWRELFLRPCHQLGQELSTQDRKTEKVAKHYAGWIANQVISGRTYDKLWIDYLKEHPLQ